MKDLKHYLNPDQSRGRISLLGMMRAMQRKGLDVKIERVKRK